MVSITPQMFCFEGKSSVFTDWKSGWAVEQVWMWQWREKFLPLLEIEPSLCSQ
jgi:hypothetical protein